MEVQSDWDNLFDLDDPSFIFPTSSPNHQSPLSVDDIEQLLFNDDDQPPTEDALNCDQFLHDILLDSPLEGEKSGEVVDLSDSAEDQKNESAAAAAADENENENSEHDPLAKKRKRQLRNRDAAVRSRERKKMHVKDLEMKSRYYEGECKRLGSLLQWYMAENQALRFSLHSSSSSNASMTKQESAVLLLESLLLGSLLWLMGIMVVLPSLAVLLLQSQSQSQSQLLTLEEEKRLPPLALRAGGSKTSRLVGKRFKSSRSRMRCFLQDVSNILLPVF